MIYLSSIAIFEWQKGLMTRDDLLGWVRHWCLDPATERLTHHSAKHVRTLFDFMVHWLFCFVLVTFLLAPCKHVKSPGNSVCCWLLGWYVPDNYYVIQEFEYTLAINILQLFRRACSTHRFCQTRPATTWPSRCIQKMPPPLRRVLNSFHQRKWTSSCASSETGTGLCFFLNWQVFDHQSIHGSLAKMEVDQNSWRFSYLGRLRCLYVQTRPGKREDGYHDLAPRPGSAPPVPGLPKMGCRNPWEPSSDP